MSKFTTTSTLKAAPDCVFSLDAGSEFGVTIFLQPPLPPPNPPDSYPPRQIRRWWVDKEKATSITLIDALGEIKTLFESPNTYTLQYHDGFHLLPIVNDKDLQSCLRYFLANLSNGNICRIYLEEKLEKREERFEARMQVKAGVASLTRQLQVGTSSNGNEKSTTRKNKMTDGERLNTFRARALAKHGDKAEIVNKTTAKCQYDQSCQKKITCKEFNLQNFDRHVELCHASKKSFGTDIRMLLTMIGQNSKKASEENEDRQD